MRSDTLDNNLLGVHEWGSIRDVSGERAYWLVFCIVLGHSSQMTELAWEKYAEAEFFLGKLSNANTDDEFRYYLSAFLSASWAVTEVLEEAYDGDEEFSSWWDTKWDNLWYNNPLFRVLGEMRHFVVHVEPVTEGAVPRVSDVDRTRDGVNIVVKDEVGVEYFLHDLPQNRVERINDEELLRQYSRKSHDMPAAELCKEYLETISQVIEEWEECRD
jgi:hypothetical protein